VGILSLSITKTSNKYSREKISWLLSLAEAKVRPTYYISLFHTSNKLEAAARDCHRHSRSPQLKTQAYTGQNVFINPILALNSVILSLKINRYIFYR